MSEIGKMEKKLLDAALKAMNNAYVLWGCKVGAAVLAENGEIYSGCNVESWVSGLAFALKDAQSTMLFCIAAEKSMK